MPAMDDKMVAEHWDYKQEFKRDFTLLESFAVAFSVLGLLPSIASTISFSLGYAGIAGTVWGWLIATIMIQFTALSMAELCSSMPTVGGLYYAAAMLAPEGWGPACSWFVGWSNIFGYLTAPCSLNYALASMILTCGSIAHPSYVPTNWHIYLLFLLLLTIEGLVAMQSTRFIGRFNIFGTVFNLLIVIIFVIWFPLGSINIPKTNSSHDVWTNFTNGTAWPTPWATIMGFLTAAYTLAGFDAPVHLAEECSNSAIASPRAIVMAAQSGLYLGWAIILVIAYTVKDIPDVVSGQYGQPFASLCLQVLGSKASLALICLSIIAQFSVATGCAITATRVLFAFSRDGALPGSSWWAKIDCRTKTPVNATWLVVALAAVLGLLMFAGPITIGAVFTMGAIAQYTSFTAPIILKLLFGRKRFVRGPWHLGIFSIPINLVALAFWLILLPAFCFPAVALPDLTLQTMNWTCLIYFGPMGLVMTWYAVSARKWFVGPKANVRQGEDRGTEEKQS
ncbi:unnamed protein product [Zymoseptoria tritici ST99CH_1E4]|uniref:Amino acid permease/ SLC12A domain-containing protein n=1 Tax=Zymoseptoria tritici ST99CH_1E4 TaxID=1276532 RepID=A0A2H1GHB4_ZYMTR|nr:unnamed protein product [Zymoseptoria tritici ST99CH_1E4]